MALLVASGLTLVQPRLDRRIYLIPFPSKTYQIHFLLAYDFNMATSAKARSVSDNANPVTDMHRLFGWKSRLGRRLAESVFGRFIVTNRPRFCTRDYMNADTNWQHNGGALPC